MISRGGGLFILVEGNSMDPLRAGRVPITDGGFRVENPTCSI